jgi:hypothetical protein
MMRMIKLSHKMHQLLNIMKVKIVTIINMEIYNHINLGKNKIIEVIKVVVWNNNK